MKSSFKFIVPLSLFLEDLWLYRFHYEVQYPFLMEICMQDVDLINELKLKPEFLENINFNNSIGRSTAENYIYAELANQTQSDRRGLDVGEYYFLETNKDIFTYTIALNLGVFLLFVGLKKITFRLAKSTRSKIFMSLYFALKERTELWVLLFMILDSNFIKLCFSSLNQLSLLFFFDFESKINSVVTIVVLFLVLQYSLISYVLLRRYSKKSSMNLLTFGK